MAKSAIITLTTAGTNTGPFNLFSDVDSYVTPFESNVPRASLIAGYTTNLIPDAATIVRVKSNGACTNYIDLTYPGTPTTTTTTTTTTSTSTTTTTAPPPPTTTSTTTTTTTPAATTTSTTTTTTTPAATTTSTTTTTTTAVPTTTSTTTTTTTSPYAYYNAQRWTCDVSCPPCCNRDMTVDTVIVGLPIGHTPIFGNYYAPVTPNGYIYKLMSTSTPSSTLILNTANNAAACDGLCGF
jgi:hypothetical protein